MSSIEDTMSSSRPRDLRVVSSLMYCRGCSALASAARRTVVGGCVTYVVAFAMGHKVDRIAGLLLETSRDAAFVPILQVVTAGPAGRARRARVQAAVNRIRPGSIGEVGVGGEHLLLLRVADMVVQVHRGRAGGERLAVVDKLEHILLAGEVAARASNGADAVANPFEGFGRESELVHPLDGELKARDPHPIGRVEVARATGSDSGKLSMDEDDGA